MKNYQTIIGSGGGSDSPPPQHIPVESPNTLQSKAIYRVVDLLCEGEIEGLSDGLKSIFLDKTPLQNADGSVNFGGIALAMKTGTPSQEALGWFPSAETPVEVNTELTVATGTITRQFTDADADAIYILVTVPALYHQKDNGDLDGSSVSFTIQINLEAPITKTITGKCISAYQRSYRLALPAGTSIYDIKLTRTTADSASAKLANALYWTSYTKVIDHKLEYPDSAYIAAEVDSELFGGNVPKRSCRLKLLKIAIPTGYTPPYKNALGIWQPAVYPVTWNGTFQSPTWCRSPAWGFYDMIINDRYGAGLPDNGGILKYALYPISKYCDELIDDGTGTGTLEPRFQLNCLIKNQQEAYTWINTMVSVFRGMCWWGPGSIDVSQDAPTNPATGESDPQILASPANVIDGLFTYEGSALKARHTVAIVLWNDPADHYNLVPEVTEDAELIAKYGYRPIEIAPFGCTSRGQAHRAGKWLLDSEEHETEIVKYTAGLDHAFIAPGKIIAVADPFYGGNGRFGGRVAAAAGTTITLDSPVTLSIGQTYSIACVLPAAAADGNPTVEERTVSTIPDGGEHAELVISSAFSVNPQVGAMWVLTASNLAPRLFRCISNTEKDGHYEIVALFHDPTKYARVESNILLEPPNYFDYSITGPIPAPVNATLLLKVYYSGGVPRNKLVFSWKHPSDARVNKFHFEYKLGNGNWERPYENDYSLAAEIMDVQEGHYYCRVQSISQTGAVSEWAEDDIDISALTMPDVTGLTLANGVTSTTFDAGNAEFTWDPVLIANVAAATSDPWFDSYQVEIWMGGVKVRTEYLREAAYTYTYEKNREDGPNRAFEIRVYQKGNQGQLSTTAATLSVSNPAPSMAGYTPTLHAGFKGIKIDWTAWSTTDTDLKSFKIYLDQNPSPSTLIGEASAVSRTWLESNLTTGTNYKIKIVPVDGFGDGTASGVGNGTPVVLDGSEVDAVLTGTITMTDSDSNTAATLLKLYDRNLGSDGVSYTLAGTDKYIQYQFGMEDYIDRVIIHAANANGRAYLAYSDDGATWNYLKAEADHTLTAAGGLVAATNQADAQTNYLQLVQGVNIATFPARVTASHCRLYLTGTYTTEIYELVFVRLVVAEQMVADNLSAISSNIGTITAGKMQSTDNKFVIDLTNKTISIEV